MASSEADVSQRVERYLARLRAHVRIDAAWLFGSQVTGAGDAGSDIDLAIVSRDFGGDRGSDWAAVSRCHEPEDGAMDILPFSWDEYVELPRGSFLREVLKHGRLVAGVPQPSSTEASQVGASGDGQD